MSGGIAPELLLEQVRNTASWALETRDTDVGTTTRHASSWRSYLLRASTDLTAWREPEQRCAYLAFMLSAHFVTVGTFVPTDVDQRIRYHAWQELRDLDMLDAALRVIDETDWWDASTVSARVLRVGQFGAISGHDGEWMAVRAGALGRALALKLDDLAESIAARIENELHREATAFQFLTRQRGQELDVLRAVTVLSHNCGDLSRVVEDWPVRSTAARHWASKFARLGHEHPERFDGQFVRAGQLNKAIMAMENHRFLALRKPRSLRRAREFLLPIGPFFDAWGEQLATHRTMDDASLADVVAALLEGHSDEPSQLGYVRALSGIHRARKGGIESLASDVPARLRKLLQSGPVREALRTEVDRFDARMCNRYRAARGTSW